MNHPLDAEQMNDLIQAFVEVEADALSEDEAFIRVATLFNHIYCMGQQHERERWIACGAPEALLRRDAP